jgi:hypothetical protein
MLSYEEAVIESCWNVIGLWEIGASDKEIGESLDRMRALIEGGPDGYAV